ncbi:hypothetical protein P153DRAFT_98628 [Dothidotthia symphoricarpi CBS 119687]|uniref:Uncharacterized protein n=1 Tax=Dothidotthia symphoricarpi CBS 119687 TaxID=1392245 RepID=A0A6A6ATA9_9PLEO|nr:uncharacterized protein P153DRAFT_98628 [Dothidotthia symphoricarpi CBS 119687]KAF2133781.1 hypothetical protein P153DRAFT_98628 [Dothidotthia symphoricarpi CBS 119687]
MSVSPVQRKRPLFKSGIFQLTDSDALGIDGTQICIFHQLHNVVFRSLLQRGHGCRLSFKVGTYSDNDFTNQTRKEDFRDDKFSRRLVFPKFSKCYRSKRESLGG